MENGEDMRLNPGEITTIAFLPNGESINIVITQGKLTNLDYSLALTDYLLRHVGPWKKFWAKYLGFKMFVGTYRARGYKVDFRYYLLWCKTCERFSVVRKHGEDNLLTCGFCTPHFYRKPTISDAELKKISNEAVRSQQETLILYS